jgi:hypothetical protein
MTTKSSGPTVERVQGEDIVALNVSDANGFLMCDG